MLGQSINEYLNHYVLVNDGKAVAIGTASLVIVGFIINPDAISKLGLLGWFGGLAAAVSVALSGSVLYPRTPRSQVGHLFWVDINSFKSANEYWNSLAKLKKEDIEREYARQNFHVSNVLVRKTFRVRAAILSLGASCVLVCLAYWWQ